MVEGGAAPWTYTWQQGRQLETMSNGSTTWTYTYDANGMRLKRTTGTDNLSTVAATALAAAAIGNGSKPLTANGYEFQMAKYSHDNHKNNDYHGNDH